MAIFGLRRERPATGSAGGRSSLHGLDTIEEMRGSIKPHTHTSGHCPETSYSTGKKTVNSRPLLATELATFVAREQNPTIDHFFTMWRYQGIWRYLCYKI